MQISGEGGGGGGILKLLLRRSITFSNVLEFLER